MAENPARKLKFHYIKSNLFRVIHVDGAIGGWTGHGNLHVGLYSERPAIPQIMEHELVPGEAGEGVLGRGTIIEGKAGFVREIDIDLMMAREKVIELRDWLNTQLEEFKKLEKVPNESEGAKK